MMNKDQPTASSIFWRFSITAILNALQEGRDWAIETLVAVIHNKPIVRGMEYEFQIELTVMNLE